MLSYDKNRVSFTGDAGCLSNENKSVLDSINYVYSLISKELEQKSDKGIKYIEEQSGVTLYKGMIFKNIGKNKSTVTVVVPQKNKQGDVIKITIKDKNKEPENYYIFDLNKVALSNDRTKILSKAEMEEYDINAKISDISSDLDLSFLNLRKIVMSRTGKDLRPNDGLIPYDISSDLAFITKAAEAADKKFEDVTLSEKQYLTQNFSRYVPSKVQRFHTFKNLGKDRLTITYGKISSGLHSGLSKIMVSDSSGNYVDSYLIKNNNKLVSNYNPKYPNYIQEKLTFYDEFSIDKRCEKLAEYAGLLKDVFIDFEHYAVSQKLPEPKILKDGAFCKEDLEKLTKVFVSYNTINNEFAKLNQPQITALKTAYGKLDCSPGKRGFEFKDAGKKGRNISYYKMQCYHPDVVRIIVNDEKADAPQYFLIQNGKLVKNYNPAYPTVVPKNLIFYNEEEIQLKNISEYIDILDKCMTDLKTYINDATEKRREAKLAELKKKQEAQILKQKIKAGLIPKPPKAPKPQKPKQQKIDTQKLIKVFIKERTSDFKSALEKAQINLDEFDAAMLEIQRQVRAFFEKNNNAEIQ